ncbi:nuclease, partial [Halobacteriales archaeon SW_7_68_16]
SARPTDLSLHRSRTVVAAVHTNDATASIPREWKALDDDHTRVRAVDVPAVDRRERTVVGTLALYQAESDHALAHLDAVSELLVLDGPIYPKGLVRWRDRDPDLAALLERERRVREPIENYVRLVEAAIEADIALAGFVKNPASKVITRAVRSIGASAPWVDDAAFFERVLRHEGDDDLTVTNWFRARGGADAPFASDGAAFGVDRDLDPEAYEVTFCAVFDPRTDLLYRIEAPYAVTRDPERRDRLTRHLLSEVAAAGGPPAVVDRADQLAGIGSRERRSLRGRIGDAFDSSPAGSYDRYRWG